MKAVCLNIVVNVCCVRVCANHYPFFMLLFKCPSPLTRTQHTRILSSHPCCPREDCAEELIQEDGQNVRAQGTGAERSSQSEC